MYNNLLFKLQLRFPFLSKIFKATSGFIPDKEDKRDYWFGMGGIDKTVLVEDGQWLPYKPEDEVQKGRYVETMGCTGYALLNVIEMLAFKQGWDYWNKSDRFTNKMSGNTPRGNSMRRVLESARKKDGMVNETTYPWNRDTFTWAEYYKNVPIDIQMLGKAFLKDYVIEYEQVSTNTALMMHALKYAPLYVAGFAWYLQGGLYRSYGQANHAFTVVGYVEGSHWLVFDSIYPIIKKLAWDYKFGACYLVTLKNVSASYNQPAIDKLIKRNFRYIMRVEKQNGAKGQLYRLSKTGLEELTTQEKLEVGIKELAENKTMTGVSELDYYSLLR